LNKELGHWEHSFSLLISVDAFGFFVEGFFTVVVGTDVEGSLLL
jgi:hypothetical protein